MQVELRTNAVRGGASKGRTGARRLIVQRGKTRCGEWRRKRSIEAEALRLPTDAAQTKPKGRTARIRRRLERYAEGARTSRPARENWLCRCAGPGSKKHRGPSSGRNPASSDCSRRVAEREQNRRAPAWRPRGSTPAASEAHLSSAHSQSIPGLFHKTGRFVSQNP